MRIESHMCPTRVLWLRHAETTSPDVWHGAESDVGLSERGRQDARRIAAVLAAENPAVVITSAMRRAVETAEPIAEVCAAPLRIEPDLHERRIGGLCGQPFSDGNAVWVETLGRWMRGETSFAPPGAESFDALRDRVLPVWHRVAEEHAGNTCVIVAHGGVIRCLLLSLGATNDWNAFRCSNLGLHELCSVGSGWRVQTT